MDKLVVILGTLNCTTLSKFNLTSDYWIDVLNSKKLIECYNSIYIYIQSDL